MRTCKRNPPGLQEQKYTIHRSLKSKTEKRRKGVNWDCLVHARGGKGVFRNLNFCRFTIFIIAPHFSHCKYIWVSLVVILYKEHTQITAQINPCHHHQVQNSVCRNKATSYIKSMTYVTTWNYDWSMETNYGSTNSLPRQQILLLLCV